MSTNKQTVRTFMDVYARNDHAGVLACLTDDVEWILAGAFHLKGKEAFGKEVEHDGFVGGPEITIDRMIEENDVVVAEGTVRMTRTDKTVLHLFYCDVFTMRGGKIRRLDTYLMEVKP